MANGAAFPHGGVLENKRPRLFAVAFPTGFVRTSQRQSSGGLKNIASMGIMALHTIHLVLQDWVTLRQVKLGLRRAVTLETGGRVFAGIHYELATPAPAGD